MKACTILIQTSLLILQCTIAAAAMPAATNVIREDAVYFDTGLSPDGGAPSLMGTFTADFIPLLDMTITSTASRGLPQFDSSGYIVTIRFFRNGALVGEGVGNGFNNQGEGLPATFSQPLSLSSGLVYRVEIVTQGSLHLFHTN